jgi:hypothetical protein
VTFRYPNSHSIPDGQNCQFAQRAPQSRVRLSDTLPFAVRSLQSLASFVERSVTNSALRPTVSTTSSVETRGLARGERTAPISTVADHGPQGDPAARLSVCGMKQPAIVRLSLEVSR